MRFPVLLTFLLLATNAGAQTQPFACDGMNPFTGAPQTVDDGTGKSSTAANAIDEASKEFEKSRAVTVFKFKKILEDPKNSYFRSMVISSFLKKNQDCQSRSTASIQNCDADAADGLTDFLKNSLITVADPQTEKDNSISLENADLLRNSQIFLRMSQDLQNQIYNTQINSKQQKRISTQLFPEVKLILLKKIAELPIDPVQKKLMSEKINAVQFAEGNSCFDQPVDATPIAKLYISNAFYMPGFEGGAVTICPGLLNHSSDFTIIQTLGHELAHSIDPCQIQVGASPFEYKNSNSFKNLDEQYPVPNLISCLRTTKSLKANVNSGADKSPAGSGFKQYCDFGPTTKFRNDQIGESVADWFGAEVLATYIQKRYPKLTESQWQDGVSNVFRPNYTDKVSVTDIHPANVDRINAILLTNPEIRKKMGCTKPPVNKIYCDPKDVEGIKKIISEDKKSEASDVIFQSKTGVQ